MKDPQEYDIIIIGGGCSGLALAYALSQKNCLYKVLILEEREKYTHDKTWCFWAQQDNIWRGISKKTWSRWSYHIDSKNLINHHGSENWSYCYLPSSDYYDFVLDKINSDRHMDLRLSSGVSTVSRKSQEQYQGADRLIDKNISSSKYIVQTNSEDVFSAHLVIDTRPPLPDKYQTVLYQEFFGVEVLGSLERSDTVGLMNNMRSDQRGFRFNYILPISENTFLFEHTRFSPDRNLRQCLEQECYQELDRLGFQYDRVLRSEYGLLPMGLTLSQETDVYKGGIAGGALRDASGYGFLRIQSWADSVAENIKNNRGLLDSKVLKDRGYGSAFQRWMDLLFLNTLRSNLDDIPNYFYQLSKNTQPDLLVRFLSDRGDMKDFINVMRGLPVKPFVRQLISDLVGG